MRAESQVCAQRSSKCKKKKKKKKKKIKKTILILNRVEMGISGTENVFHLLTWTILGIDLIHISTFTFVLINSY